MKKYISLRWFLRRCSGLSLIEVIIYIMILSVFSIMITNFLLQILNTYHRARAERETLSNARLLLETVTKSVASARTIYLPTTRLDVDGGQLALMTEVGAGTAHTAIYLDFWVDNGRMWMKQDGAAALPLSASSIRVPKFRLERIAQGVNREAVKITLQADYALSRFPSSITLNATTVLRGNY